jgi:ribulose-5-phosphate 4-epimerase/fuculose-1-phosphate aldolase
MAKRPKHTDSHRDLIKLLVQGNHILYDQGVVDGFGHLSARDDRDPKHFLLARSCAPSLVTAADILTFDFEGNPVDETDQKLYIERFIHAAIYAARPDVMSVVHSHSPAIIPFGITQVPLQPVCHVSGFLGQGVGRFDSRPVAGDTNLLVSDMRLGRALAVALGDNNVALMRGHGSVAVGGSVMTTVYRAIYTEVNARIQMEALRLGGPIEYLSEGESRLANMVSEPVMERPWALWVENAERNRR